MSVSVTSTRGSATKTDKIGADINDTSMGEGGKAHDGVKQKAPVCWRISGNKAPPLPSPSASFYLPPLPPCSSVNYLHHGAPKFWYTVPPSARARFETCALGMLPASYQQVGGRAGGR